MIISSEAMKNTEFFKGKKVTIIGLARSGYACAGLLANLARAVSVTEKADNPELLSRAAELRGRTVYVELGGHSRAVITGSDLVVLSPGIPDTAEPVRWALEEGIPVISEIECAFRLCPAGVIAVTGSTGKTTVTTLIGECLRAAGRRAFVCGNIGTPFSQEVGLMQEGDWVSLEVSSFQLEHCRTFKPRVAVVLNCTPNHLDRYASMEEYGEAKKRIFMNQDSSDTLILNSDDPLVASWAGQSSARVVFFGASGHHNQNHAAVCAVAQAVGLPESATQKVLSSFKGIEHRLEFVDTIGGVHFINDSKATTLESALWALHNTDGRIILIAGGKHKGIDYRGLREAARRKLSYAVLIGEARNMIRDALGDSVASVFADNLAEAVRLAFERAQPGESILLSPMCSSYDMFRDYEERGRVFKEAVRSLSVQKRDERVLK